MMRLLTLALFAAALGLAGAAKAEEAPTATPNAATPDPAAARTPAPWPSMDDADFDVTEMLC